MINSVSETTTRTSSSFVSLVNKDYKKGYSIPLLPHQQNGILSSTLFSSKNSILRIIPGYNEETGEIYRQNINCSEYSEDDAPCNYLSDTFCMANVVSRFGSNPSTFVTDYAPGSPDFNKYGGDTVIHTFIRDIMYSTGNNAKRSKLKGIPLWETWVTMQGPLKFDKKALLMQCLAFQLNDRTAKDQEGNDLLDEDGSPVPLLYVIAVDHTKSRENLISALVKPTSRNSPLDALTNNEYGGMAELEGNLLFMNSVEDVTSAKKDPSKKYFMLRPSVQAGGKGWTPTPYPLDEETVKQLFVPWSKVINYMTAEEQLHYLAKEFGCDTVNYVVGRNPLFADLSIPEDILRSGYGRYSQFTDGVKEVRQSVSISAPVKTASVLGQAKVGYTSAKHAAPKGLAALGAGLKSVRPAADSGEEEIVAEPTWQRSRGDAIPGVPDSVGNQDAIKATLAKIRAAKKPAVNVANTASALLEAEVDENALDEAMEAASDYIPDTL